MQSVRRASVKHAKRRHSYRKPATRIGLSVAKHADPSGAAAAKWLGLHSRSRPGGQGARDTSWIRLFDDPQYIEESASPRPYRRYWPTLRPAGLGHIRLVPGDSHGRRDECQKGPSRYAQDNACQGTLSRGSLPVQPKRQRHERTYQRDLISIGNHFVNRRAFAGNGISQHRSRKTQRSRYAWR